MNMVVVVETDNANAADIANAGDDEHLLLSLRSRYEQAGQSNVFAHFDKLSDAAKKAALLEQLQGIAVEKLGALLDAAARATAVAGAESSSSSENMMIQPFAGAVARLSSSSDGNNNSAGDDDDSKTPRRFAAAGMEAIRRGQVAALVLAGGQGTRLGYAGPKGMYDISLPSGKTLFALMAERIQKLSSLAAADGGSATRGNNNTGTNTTTTATVQLPFYIMTSPLNHDDTVSYFESNDYFGLGASNVFFFRQGMLPCLTEDGKIILEAADKVAMAPDGNGGIYPSLQSSGALDDMTQRGVKYLHVFSIDNALVKPADPVFVGYCIEQEADCGNKVVWKAHPHEQVGVVASRCDSNGENCKPCIVEYSEITTDMAEQTDESTGLLVYGAGNICNHFYTLDFIRDVVLPNMGNLYHVAHKKIPYYDEATATTITPETNNGIKLETFIFDVFPFSERMAVLDVERSEEFAPVKNKPGSPSDSPDTAREMISALAKKWIMAAGGTLTGDQSSICEISPSTSYAGEGLEEIARGKEIVCPFSL